MGMTTKIYKMITQAGAGLIATAWLSYGMILTPQAFAADVVDTCTTQMSMCKIGYQQSSESLYPKDKINSIKSDGSKGCIDPMPTQVQQVREEVCLRPDDCSKYPGTPKVTSGKYAGKCLRPHSGMDLATTKGTEVKAAADGEIFKISTCYGGGGNTVIMRHKKAGGGTYTTTYMHLEKFSDKAKDIAGTNTVIPKGTTIGFVGGTSCKNGTTKYDAYGAHLHFEVRDGNDGKGQVMSPTCGSLQALCDGNAPITEEPVTEDYTPDTEEAKAEATLTGCGKMYSEDNLSAFHQQGESKGNAGAFNNCWAEDKGGCSYGLSQMVCYRDSSKWNDSTMAKYLQHLKSTDNAKYKALEVGGSLQSTIQAACQPPATEFANKWKALAAGDSSFGTSQTQYIEDSYLTYGKNVLKNAGMGSLLNRSPEIDMIILAGSVAGAGPMRNTFNAAKKILAPKTLETATDEEIIKAYYTAYPDNMYPSYNDKTPFAKRAAVDSQQALESLAIRKEMANGLTQEQASQKVTGKKACAEDEYPTAKVKLGSASRTPYTSSYSGGQITENRQTDQQCNVESYRNSFQSCIFCDIFGILFNTASTIAKKSFNALADGVIMLVCVGFALWVGMTVMQFISAMEQKNPSILVKTILNKAFLILIVVTILRLDSAEFFKLALEPIFNTGFKLAKIATEGADGETCKNTFNILTKENGGGLPASMGVSILCTIETIQGKILDVMALGSTSICVATKIESWRGIWIFPHLGYLIVGILLWIAAILLLVIYPFLLIDSVLQLTVATALLPAAIGAFAFKSTQKYVSKVWDAFLNCMFNFIFLSLIIFILTNGLTDVLTRSAGDSALFAAGTGSGYKIILERLAWWGTAFLQLVFYMILGWAVLGEANSFAGSFAKGIGIKGIGANVGGLAASTANKVAMGTGGAALGVTKKIGGKVADRGREAYANFKTNRRANKINNDARTTVDANGNKTLQHRTFFGLGRKVTDTLQVAPDGTKTVTRTKQSLFGHKATAVENDKFIRNKKSYDSNGNLVREEMSMNAAAGKSLLNRDGTRNDVAVHAVKTGSGASNDTVDKALMNQMMKERMGGVPGADMNKEFKNRTSTRSVDAQGRDVFTVTQTNTDGSTSIFQMTKGGNRDMLTYTRVSQNGKAQSYSSDGIINKKSSYKMDKNGNIDPKSVKNNYAFSKFYNSQHTKMMDSNGKFNQSIPAGEIMMSAADMQLFQAQVATYGKDQPMAEFGK